jgi:hypothetical protein
MPRPHPSRPRTLKEFRGPHQRQPEVWKFIHGMPKLMAAGSMSRSAGSCQPPRSSSRTNSSWSK